MNKVMETVTMVASKYKQFAFIHILKIHSYSYSHVRIVDYKYAIGFGNGP